MYTMTRSRLSSLALALCAAHSTGAHAGIFDANFDPTGTGTTGLLISGFDWNATSFLARGGMTAIRNFSAGTGPVTFDVHTHATLSAFQTPSGPRSSAGLNSAYEFTMIGAFGMEVTNVTNLSPGVATATFRTTAGGRLRDGSNPFLAIYHDTTPDSVALSGSGYGAAGDTLVARANAVISQTAGIFLSFDSPTVALDSLGTNDWPGVETVTGTGSQTVIQLGDFTDVNLNFFTNGIAGLALVLDSLAFANTSISLPFTNVDPSDCFSLVGSFCTADTATAPRLEADGPIIPNIGSVNGRFASDAPDFLAQTDFSSPIATTVIPVPAAVWLFGSALAAGLGLARRRVA
jgi:hypothetical protein